MITVEREIHLSDLAEEDRLQIRDRELYGVILAWLYTHHEAYDSGVDWRQSFEKFLFAFLIEGKSLKEIKQEE